MTEFSCCKTKKKGDMHDYSKLSRTKKLRFRDWLKQKLDNNEVKGLEWIDRRRGLFKIPWKHGSRHGWTVRDDAEIFRQWALHSGRYREGVDQRDPIKWKTNFRCTLNALSDFKEVRGRSCPRGPSAYKIYIMKSEKLKSQQKEKGEKRKYVFFRSSGKRGQMFLLSENKKASELQ